MPHALTVETRRAEALIPYGKNPRTHSDAQIAQIAASIAEFGWSSPIPIDCDNGVTLGHHIADWAFDNYLRPVNGGPGTSSVGPNGPLVQLLTIAPNPTVGATQFRFAVSEPGHLGVAIFDAQGRSVAFARANAERRRTLAEGATLNQRERLWFQMTEGLMNDINGSLESSITRHLNEYLMR